MGKRDLAIRRVLQFVWQGRIAPEVAVNILESLLSKKALGRLNRVDEARLLTLVKDVAEHSATFSVTAAETEIQTAIRGQTGRKMLEVMGFAFVLLEPLLHLIGPTAQGWMKFVHTLGLFFYDIISPPWIYQKFEIFA